MNRQENPNMGPWMNIPGTIKPLNNMQGNMQGMNPIPMYQAGMQPMMEGVKTYKCIYPEIFYKIQPFVMMACDEIDVNRYSMPSQEMVDQMSDNIYDDVCRMHPDLQAYAQDYEDKATQLDFDERSPIVRPRFRRRGVLRDLISILLLSELFRRRRY